jgi:hypothetical protein
MTIRYILTFILAIALGSIKSQTYSYEIEMNNFKQLNETEISWDLFIKKGPGSDDFGLHTMQIVWDFNNDLYNLDGKFYSELLTIDHSETELFQKTGWFDNNHFAVASNAVDQLVWATTVVVGNNDNVTVVTDEWLKIATFHAQLGEIADPGPPVVYDPHNFSDVDPLFAFQASGAQILVRRCDDFTGANPDAKMVGNTSTPVTREAIYPDLGVKVNDRQLAGYWFEGDGDWDNNLLWNNVTVANNNTLPGPNSNAIINGNVTIPDGLDVSLLPDLVKSGNGGEVTVLTGAEPLYSIELVPNGTGATVTLYDAAYNVLPNPSTGIEAGTEFYFNTTGIPPSGTFINWTDQNSNVIGTTQFYGPYTMPAEDMVITANWSSKSSIITTKSKSILSSLTIVPGASLTVDKLFNDSSNGAEAIIVLSDATGTGYLIHNNEDVEATVQRYLSQGKYHYVSSPIVDAPFSMFQTEPVPVEPAYSDFFMWVEDYPEPDGPSWVNLNYPHYPATSTLTVGRGYAVADSENEFTKEFVGEVNVGDIVYNGTYTPKTDGPPYWNNRGYNLVGNPYPAALDADAFIDANDQTTYNIHGLYFWDEAPNYEGNRNDYAVYTEAGGTGTVSSTLGSGNVPTGYIAPGQGFMAQVISDPMNANADVDIVFNNSMRVTDETYFYKKSSDKDRIWLNVTGPEGDFNQILVAFMEGAEEGFDRTDAQKIRGNNKLAFYSILQDADFSIQGFPVLEATDTYEIPLGVFAGFSGQYTFDVQEIENFAPDTDITFEDRLAGQIINLRTTTQYTAHIADEGDIRDRFFLHINGPTSVPVIDSKLTKVYAVNNQIYIRHTGSSEILDVEVINTLGQTVISTPVNATETTITVPGRNLVYIVKVRTSEGIESHKLLIR